MQRDSESGVPAYKGPWANSVLNEFLNITAELSGLPSHTGEPRPVALADLAMTPRKRQQCASEQITRMHSHEVYRHLAGLANFRQIERERKRLAKSNAHWAKPDWEARLLYYIALLVGAFDPNFVPRRATLAQQRKAHAATKKLLGLLSSGAQPNDVFALGDLRRLLAQLDTDLNAKIAGAETTGRRAARADRDAPQRYWLIGFCVFLVESFGEAPPKIVSEVAAMINYSPDAATVSRYIGAAHKRARSFRPPTLAGLRLQISPKTRRYPQ